MKITPNQRPFTYPDRRSRSQINMVKRLILSGQPPNLILMLIIATVFPTEILTALKR